MRGSLVAVLLLFAGPALAALPQVSLSLPGAADVSLGQDDLAKLPAVTLQEAYATEKATEHHSFSGPLLWAVLQKAGLKPVPPRQYAVITGSDGYGAVIALGEIAPKFEGKQVILALAEDGKPLGAGHYRLVVPGDQAGGRYVRDITAIAIMNAPHGK